MEALELPQSFVRSFTRARQPENVTDKGMFYGFYTRLFYYLFKIDSPFSFEMYDVAADGVRTFVVEHNGRPVMVIQIQIPGNLNDDGRRREADERMRQCFLSLHPRLGATLHVSGISIFGSRLAFYDYVVADQTRVTRPSGTTSAASVVIDGVPPVEWWHVDLLEAGGFARLRHEALVVVQMCN